MRRLVPRQLRQRIEPELPIMSGKPLRQEGGDCVNVGFLDLTAAQALYGRIVRVDHEHLMSLIVMLREYTVIE